LLSTGWSKERIFEPDLHKQKLQHFSQSNGPRFN